MPARHTLTTATSCLIAIIAVTLMFTRAAPAQSLTISFDEKGSGTIAGPGGATIPLTSLGVTTDPTSGMSTLTYFLRGNPLVDGRNIAQGDLELIETPGTPPSDLLRWLDNGRLYVYSDRPEPGELPDLADVGLPPNRLGNLLTLQETGPEGGINGLFGYVPAQNQPGFIGGSGPGATTYNFTSDTPEPGSFALLALGGAGSALFARRRRRNRSGARPQPLINLSHFHPPLTTAKEFVMNTNQKKLVMSVGSCLIAAFIVARTAAASVITFDENGKGTIQTPTGATLPLVAIGNIPDPVDPTNGLLPLVYDLTASGIVSPVVPGDMDVLEIPGTPNSDLLRWTNSPATGRSFLVVYSDRAEPGEIPDLADVGLPALRQPNLIARQETGPEGGLNGVFGYAPTQGMPGFFINSAGDTPVYNFISDTPEPASLGVAALGGIALLRRRRRRH